jgi:ribosomal-protein-alanine N-acetyltransferase
MPTLTTERLLLRPYRDDDFDAVHAYGSDPEVVRHMLWGPNTEAQTREFLQTVQQWSRNEPRTKFDFAIELRQEEKMIGGCGIYLKGPELLVGEMGYVLHPAYHRRGIMAEAVQALIDYGFGELHLHRIFARCHPDNRASARVMQKCGMQYEGRIRESERVKGEWWDYLFYSILEQEWRSSDVAGGLNECG